MKNNHLALVGVGLSLWALSKFTPTLNWIYCTVEHTHFPGSLYYVDSEPKNTPGA